MKNRILGITVLLAMVVLGLAFMSCPADTDDRVITFTNMCSIPISIVTDAGSVNLKRATISDNPSETITKKGSDITLTSITYNNGTGVVNDDPDNYIDISGTVTPGKGKSKGGGVSLGSGTMIFVPRTLDKDGNAHGANGNPANIFTNISVIPLDE